MPDRQMVEIDTRSNLYKHFPRGGVGAEIGVCRGVNAANLFLATRPIKLHLVDIWARDKITEIYHPIDLHYNDWEQDVRLLFEAEIQSGEVEIHRKTGIAFLNSCQDASLDWIYIDGDHSYENLSRELRLAVSKVKAGGIIAGHDFVVHKGWKSGVVRAVMNEIQRGTMVMKMITNEEFPSYLCTVSSL